MTPLPTVWENQILVCDASHFLRALPTAYCRMPLIVFSPPYNLGTTTGGGFARAEKRHDRKPFTSKWTGGILKYGYDTNDDAHPMETYCAWLADVLDTAWHALTPDGAIFFNHKPRILDGALLSAREYVPPHLQPYVRQEIVWQRAGGINFSRMFYLPTTERIVIIAKPAWRLRSQGASGVGDLWYIPQEHRTWHPAPFPQLLVERILETTGATVVCDPFMGSGTTAKAARLMGIPFVGCDQSAVYVQRAMQEVAEITPYHPTTHDLFDQLALPEDASLP